MFRRRGNPNNISLGADGQLNHGLATLQGQISQGQLSETIDFMPGIALRADPLLELKGTYRSPAGRILEIDAQMHGTGNWIGLHLSLPARDITNAGVLGFAARASASETCVLKACLRSGNENGFQDCFFDKHLLLRPEEDSHVDALPVGFRDELPNKAPWRELILFLPTEDFRIALIDLRVFIV